MNYLNSVGQTAHLMRAPNARHAVSVPACRLPNCANRSVKVCANLKIQRDPQALLIDEELEDCSIDEIRDSLPPQQPRFVLVNYMLCHSDGRKSFPMCLIFYSPSGCNPEQQMLYAGSKNNLIKECELTKNFEIRDLDELTEEFICEKLGMK